MVFELFWLEIRKKLAGHVVRGHFEDHNYLYLHGTELYPQRFCFLRIENNLQDKCE